ncbi:tyrosine-protein phosphatase [Sphingobacterium sp. UT-1RO-CII-1]|uniref:tyrosine-protein phosphatase n=1 Tax=Sphingobacterium sp. UT-1RO-CII-1 TaxID=2995225 RepID=UPI00227AEB18|nr:tyrosine-protein phosphatase [Sphingobacterium sp. UT-1RO-CII-1]MCY4780457.1 tyrosine-protein phosphatase [Sphingobacterium sp. UT-1RO-CII-1]
MLVNLSDLSAQMPKKERTLKETYQALRIINGNYQLLLPEKKQEVFIGKHPKEINFQSPLYTLGDTIIEASPQERLFFAIVSEKDTTIISERKLPLSGTANFRDIGGIKTSAGRHIIWGKFFRADELSGLKEEDFPYLLNSGIKDVYDLRTNEEIGQKKDNLPAALNWIHYPIFEEGDNLYMRAVMQQFNEENFSEENAREMLIIANREFVKNSTEKFSTLVKQMMDKPTASLFHCTAGKDRTGFTAALILAILGADRQTIINEYLMTNYYTYDKLNNDMDKIIPMLGGKIKPEVIIPLMTVDRSYIEAGLQEIDDIYGDMDSYIRHGLQISDELRQYYIQTYTY